MIPENLSAIHDYLLEVYSHRVRNDNHEIKKDFRGTVYAAPRKSIQLFLKEYFNIIYDVEDNPEGLCKETHFLYFNQEDFQKIKIFLSLNT